jgi:hypothetical protein
MAKDKIRKLLREREVLNRRINNLAGMLALLAHKEGGELSFTEAELQSIPDAEFNIEKTNDVFTLKLKLDDAGLSEKELAKHVEQAKEIEETAVLHQQLATTEVV